MDSLVLARQLAGEHVAVGDVLGWFEKLYAKAAGDASMIPWADLRVNGNLRRWLDREKVEGRGRRAMVVGCRLGDDAQELARRGYEVTAFDISPTAVLWCQQRFPKSPAKYRVGDLLSPVREWAGTFELVVESYTSQVFPPPPKGQGLRERAMRSLVEFLSATGELLVICRGRLEGEPEGQMPWPLTRGELEGLARETGLTEKRLEEYFDEDEPTTRRFRGAFNRRG